MSAMSAGGVLFDLDGTLLDLPVDIEPVRREVERLLREAGDGGPARPLLDAIDRADRAAAGQGGGRLRARARALLDAAELAAAPRARARPGAVGAAAALARRGLRLAIVTDNGRACLAPALAAAGLDAFAWHAVTRDDVARPKPSPDGVVAAARAMCPAGGALWFAGDTPRDLAACRAAAGELGPAFRLHAAAVLGGRASEAALRQAGPDSIASTLADFAARVAAG